MGKNTNFFGQPIYGQLIKSLDREKIVEIKDHLKGWQRSIIITTFVAFLSLTGISANEAPLINQAVGEPPIA